MVKSATCTIIYIFLLITSLLTIASFANEDEHIPLGLEKCYGAGRNDSDGAKSEFILLPIGICEKLKCGSLIPPVN